MEVFRPKPREDIIEELEELLAMARTGEVTAITFLAELTGARIRGFHSSVDSVMSLGHLARMMATANTALDGAAQPVVGTK